MQIETSIIGIVFAFILFIIISSAIVLYLAFRIKETFRGETRRGVEAVKVAFLIGILFLVGGGFYFLAQSLRTNPPGNGGGKPALTFNVSYPTSPIRANSNFTMDFVIANPTTYTANGTAIQTSTLFQDFKVVSNTTQIVGSVIMVGKVPSGTTVVTVGLTAPQRPGSYSYTLTLDFIGASQPIPQQISISVTG